MIAPLLSDWKAKSHIVILLWVLRRKVGWARRWGRKKLARCCLIPRSTFILIYSLQAKSISINLINWYKMHLKGRENGEATVDSVHTYFNYLELYIFGQAPCHLLQDNYLDYGQYFWEGLKQFSRSVDVGARLDHSFDIWIPKKKYQNQLCRDNITLFDSHPFRWM